MKIRRLEIQGFKSFADRTVFDFEAGMSAIVGPNGCGKSNVVDAIKWVLGDMSPRSLRGKKMEDVIFAGSRTRKRLGRAEVTLVFENEDGLLPTERSEVSISRRLHRTGESEYFVNRESARLKDIRELFLDTGAGAGGNAIMEQGQIDALLAANPRDRRGIFEEAAGVSRYKQRRKEADQRLVRTRDNLERLRDVLDLENKRLRSLKAQAARAHRFKALREELTKKRVLRAVVRYREVAGERSTLTESLREAEAREAEAATELASLETAVTTREEERERAREGVHALEQQIAAAASDVRAAKDRAAYAQRDAEQIEARREALAQQEAADRTRLEAVEQEIEGLDAAAKEAESVRAADQAKVDAAGQELATLDREAAAIRDAHDGAKRDALNALGQLGEIRNEASGFLAEVRQADERRRRLGEQRGELLTRAAGIETQHRELLALTASLDEATRSHAQALKRAEEQRALQLREREALQTRRQEDAEHRASRRARLDVLQRLQAAREGMDAGARRILDALADEAPAGDGSRGGLLGILADLITPDAARAAELDLRLGQAGGALVARSVADAMRWVAWLREHGEGERARFLCLDFEPKHTEAAPGHDAEALGIDGALQAVVQRLLDRTRWVANLDEGFAVAAGEGCHAVTPAGDRVTATGTVLGGREEAGLGLVERTAEIRELQGEIARLDEAIAQADAQAQAADESLRTQQEHIRRLRKEIQERSEDRQRRGEALARAERERSHLEESVRQIAAELAELLTQGEQAQSKATALTDQANALSAQREALEEQAEEAARGYAAIEARRREAADRRMQCMLLLAEAKARAEAAVRRVARAQEEVQSLTVRLAAHAEERDVLARRLGEAEIEATEAEALAKARDGARSEAGEALVKARAALEAIEREARSAADRRRTVQHLHSQLSESLSQFRMQDAALRTRIEGLLEQVRSDHGLELEAVAAEYEATPEFDFEAMSREVEDLQRKLASLGNVNLSAIDELGEVQEHVDFLTNQENDLLTAAADLEKAISQLDEITTERFGAAFEVIRENFRGTFRRLFGGGRADVMLEDASNVLDSGIEIVARPPGKEQRTISLLSGGERTLTATALLFAVFQAKPSPFAILDEVDAALDEANVRRLLGLIDEFTDRCQFIVITHAKSTMEAADLLYGVTMEEPGVSKKVAVRLTDDPQTIDAPGAPAATG